MLKNLKKPVQHQGYPRGDHLRGGRFRSIRDHIMVCQGK